MELSDEQRAWLELAIRSKGKFTTKRAVRKQMQAYLRRREKTANATAGLPASHANYQKLQNTLKNADELAEAGKLKEAYTYLELAKNVARADAMGRSTTIAVDDIKNKAAQLGVELRTLEAACNDAVTGMDNFLENRKGAPTAGACATKADAVNFRAAFVAQEVQLRGTFDPLRTKCAAAATRVNNSFLTLKVTNLKADIAALKVAGKENEVAAQEKAVDRMLATLEGKGGLYTDPAVLRKKMAEDKEEFERHIFTCKDFGKYVSREGEDVATDSKVDAVRGDLNRDDDARLKLVEREEARLERARAELKILGLQDDDKFGDTSTSAEFVTPEPPTFVASDVFDQLAGDIAVVAGAEISDEDADTISATIAAKLKTFATDPATDQDELFDLTLKKSNDLMGMIAQDVFGTTNSGDLSDSQKAFLKAATTKAGESLAENLPNRIEADGSKVNVGGVDYTNPVILKQGGNGKAVRYTDANGNTVIVKSSNVASEGARMAMVREMEIHRRAMKGRDPSVADDGIVDFHGAARAEDGALFMIMEEVKGGDMEDLSDGLKAAAGLGLIPPAARQAIALGNLLDTVKALKNLERQGLVHHDLKEQNVMMTADGKIKIIDFGESAFLNQDGVLEDAGGSTPGYTPEDSVETAKADNYAVSGMLQSMVLGSGLVQDVITGNGDTKMDGGVLGRLVKALSDPDPEKRPSLDAILNSSLAASYDNDYSPENVKDLQTASLDFAMLSTQISGGLDLANLGGELSQSSMDDLTDPMKLKAAQRLIETHKNNIATWTYNIESGNEGRAKFLGYTEQKLEDAKADILLLEAKVVKPMLQAALDEAEDEYTNALNDRNLKVDIKIGDATRNVTLKMAIETRDKLAASIQEKHDRFMAALNGVAETPVTQNVVDRMNALLTKMETARKDIDDTVYAAVGAEAKLFLAKSKLEKAAAPFGSIGSPHSELGIKDETGLDQLISDLATEKSRTELEEKAAG